MLSVWVMATGCHVPLMEEEHGGSACFTHPLIRSVHEWAGEFGLSLMMIEGWRFWYRTQVRFERCVGPLRSSGERAIKRAPRANSQRCLKICHVQAKSQPYVSSQHSRQIGKRIYSILSCRGKFLIGWMLKRQKQNFGPAGHITSLYMPALVGTSTLLSVFSC